MTIPFEEAVAKGLKIESERQWALGDLALDIHLEYGDQTLKRFADEIRVNVNTLEAYRGVAKAWQEKSTRVDIS